MARFNEPVLQRQRLLLIGRAPCLQRKGLAEEVQPGTRASFADAEKALRALGEHRRQWTHPGRGSRRSFHRLFLDPSRGPWAPWKVRQRYTARRWTASSASSAPCKARSKPCATPSSSDTLLNFAEGKHDRLWSAVTTEPASHGIGNPSYDPTARVAEFLRTFAGLERT